MNLQHEEFDFQGSTGDITRCDARYLPDGSKKPVVIFIHGFKGFKDWGGFPYVRTQLALSGFVVIGLDFSHNGIGRDPGEFTELDKFAANTFTCELREVSDLLSLISTYSISSLPATEYDSSTIFLFGHSRGAAEAILSGASEPLVTAVCAWAPVSSFHRYSDRQRQQWREQGYMEVENSRTGQLMKLNTTLLDDMEQHPAELDILDAAKRLATERKKMLIIAGSEDLTAPVKESEQIAAAYGDTSCLTVIANTGHKFGAVHPFEGTTPALEQAIALTINFFKSFNNT